MPASAVKSRDLGQVPKGTLGLRFPSFSVLGAQLFQLSHSRILRYLGYDSLSFGGFILTPCRMREIHIPRSLGQSGTDSCNWALLTGFLLDGEVLSLLHKPNKETDY